MNRIKPAAVILLLFAVIIPITAQRLRTAKKLPAQKAVVTTTRKSKKTQQPLRPKQSRPDTVYSAYTAKQHGWFSPLTILTKEQARHRNMSYRFTNRNAQGRWLKMEVVNGRGKHVGGKISPYILNLNNANTDTTANKEWITKLFAACVFESIQDPTGKEIIQERAYDKDNNLVYIFSHTPIGYNEEGRKQYIGSYRDIYGLPAEMRKDTTNTYTYGTLVMITEDRWGNDSIIEYMDAKGIKKPNSDGVPMGIYVHDKNGFLVRQESRNIDGERTLDNCGNCGIEFEWQNGRMSKITYMNDQWEPMRMPPLRGNENAGSAGEEIIYDDYGQQKSVFNLDVLGNHSTNNDGIVEIEIRYNDFGEEEERRLYGEYNELKNCRTGWAIMKNEYDGKGSLLSCEWLGKDGKPNSNMNFLSKVECEYNSDGKLKSGRQYKGWFGTHSLYYEEVHDSTSIHYKAANGAERVDSLDVKGRQFLLAFKDKEGNPITWPGFGFSRMTADYKDREHGYIGTTCYFDDKLNPVVVNGFSKIVVNVDTVSGLVKTWKYIPDGSLVDSYIKWSNKNDFSDFEGQYDMNSFGVPSRAGGSSGVSHYYAQVLKTQRGEFSTFVGRDEFGEPDYISGKNALYYYYRINNAPFDEYNNIISNFNNIRDELPKAFSIEVTDSLAYTLGLKDNDIIVLDGDYVNIPERNEDLISFKAKRILAMNSQANKQRRMVVFRIDPETKEYGLVAIDGLIGNDSRNGFLAHVRYLTEKQQNRIIESCMDSDLVNDSVYLEGLLGLLETGEKEIIIEGSDMYRYERFSPYAIQVTDPSVVIAVYIPDMDIIWRIGESFDAMREAIFSYNANQQYYPEIIQYIVRNGIEVERVCSNGKYLNTSFDNVYVNDSIFNCYQELASLAIKSIYAEKKNIVELTRLPQGEYVLQPEANTQYDGFLKLLVDNKGKIAFDGKFLASYFNMGKNYIFSAQLDSDGEYVSPVGNSLSLGKYGTYKCEYVEGEQDANSRTLVETANDAMYMNDDVRNNVISNLKWLSQGSGYNVFLRETYEGEYAIQDAQGRVVPLRRVGKK